MPGHHLSPAAAGGGLDAAFQSLGAAAAAAALAGGGGGIHHGHPHFPPHSGGPGGVSSLVAKALTHQTEIVFHYK